MSCIETELQVRYAETDAMGIVYHANYLIWFETARTELLRAVGYGARQLDDQGIFFPVIQVDCRYLSPARFDDHVIVCIWVKGLSFAKLTFEYEVRRKDDNVVLVQGTTVHGFSNRSGKPGSLKKWHPLLWSALQKTLENNI